MRVILLKAALSFYIHDLVKFILGGFLQHASSKRFVSLRRFSVNISAIVVLERRRFIE